MRQAFVTLAVAGMLCVIGPQVIPAHAQRVEAGKVMTIHTTTAARFFDMSPTGSAAPPGWMAPSFDDSSWDHAVTQNCGTGMPFHTPISPPAVTSGPVWGPNNEDNYLFRQTFRVPKARSYYGSVLAYTSTAPFARLAIDGKVLDGVGNVYTGRIAVAQYLHPGRNVLTAELATYARSCNSFDDSIALRMTGLQRQGALSLSWRKVPSAARYYLQVWLVKAAPGRTITPDSQVNVATQTTGPRYTLDAAALPAGTYQWRTAAVNVHGSLISDWTPARTVTLT